MSPSLPCTMRPRTSNHQSNRRVRRRGRTTPFLRPPASIQYNNQRVQPRVRPRTSVSVYLYQSSSSNPLHQSTQGISCPTSGHDSESKKFTQTLTRSRPPESPASAPAGRRSGSRRDRATASPPTRVSRTASSYRIAASSTLLTAPSSDAGSRHRVSASTRAWAPASSRPRVSRACAYFPGGTRPNLESPRRWDGEPPPVPSPRATPDPAPPAESSPLPPCRTLSSPRQPPSSPAHSPSAARSRATSFSPARAGQPGDLLLREKLLHPETSTCVD
ncbi:putative proline-rich receptor-like protein kinase PERK3 [Iris pallida]|uniref:Proline-rich receptor-like protein kinase PERK3 n=1 Tax=Iris pallida TaxID=29817 RepID=A0AAX6GMG1_IRIPA|nr:putative proline-rich receptor-like protein kinase PERK3 [Iris pallida]